MLCNLVLVDRSQRHTAPTFDVKKVPTRCLPGTKQHKEKFPLFWLSEMNVLLEILNLYHDNYL
jgi:hypothetical protein